MLDEGLKLALGSKDLWTNFELNQPLKGSKLNIFGPNRALKKILLAQKPFSDHRESEHFFIRQKSDKKQKMKILV